MTLKERYQLIKAAFNGTPPPAPAPTPNPAPAAMAAKTYKLQDGVTEISINQAGEIPAIGDMVMIGGAPAPANTYTLSDGATLTVDATGAITVYTPAAPVPAPPAPAPPPAPVTLAEMTPEQMKDIYAKFAGSIEDQVASLIIMVKALMESSYGWKIREGQEAAAIEVYKETIAQKPIVTIEEMSSVFTKEEKFNEQVTTIGRHEETIKQLLELTEQLVEMPNADPVTLTGSKKEKFERTQKKENAVLGIAAALKDLKKQN
jgi:hypothetical protein